jgi:hypothetical protein
MTESPTLADDMIRETFRPTHRRADPRGNLRNLIASARKFVMDEAMSTMLADLAWATLGSVRHERRDQAFLEGLRTSARLPHRLTWVEYDARARARRAREEYGSRVDPARVPSRCGWLLEETNSLEFSAIDVASHSITDPARDRFEPHPRACLCRWLWRADEEEASWNTGVRRDQAPAGITLTDITGASATLTGVSTYCSPQVCVGWGIYDGIKN